MLNSVNCLMRCDKIAHWTVNEVIALGKIIIEISPRALRDCMCVCVCVVARLRESSTHVPHRKSVLFFRYHHQTVRLNGAMKCSLLGRCQRSIFFSVHFVLTFSRSSSLPPLSPLSFRMCQPNLFGWCVCCQCITCSIIISDILSHLV